MARERFENGHTNYNAWRDTRSDNKKHIVRMNTINDIRDHGIRSYADYIRLVNTVCVSEMTGKLTGFYSISTSVLMNDRCQARAKNPNTICARCYAAMSLNNYDGLMMCMESNYIILNTWLIPESAWQTLALPSTNGKFRIEAFGDVASVTCARNYIRIIKTHAWLHFGVWTKNSDLWIEAFEQEGGKPSNMTFLVSSIFMDKPYVITEKERKYVDHVFTVYRPATIDKNNIDINCGSRNCNGCMKCYTPENKDFNIREKLK